MSIIKKKSFQFLSVTGFDFLQSHLSRQLIPTLRISSSEVKPESAEYGNRLVKECREGLSKVLPLKDNELKFLDLLLDQGKIHASLLTSDRILQQRIQSQPLLKWKAINVHKHKDLS